MIAGDHSVPVPVRAHLDKSSQKLLMALVDSDEDLPRLAHICGSAPIEHIYILQEGWAISSVRATYGKQFSKLHLPGDILGLAGIGMKASHETVTAISRVRIGRIGCDDLMNAIDSRPPLARAMFRGGQRNALASQYLELALTRLEAPERVAFLLRRIAVRLGRGTALKRFDFWLTQDNIADMTGLTSVHVNRVLRRLLADGILSSSRHHIEILDVERFDRLSTACGPIDHLDLPWFSPHAS